MTARLPDFPEAAMTRRGFGQLLTWTAAGWTLFALAMGGMLNAMVRFLFPNFPFDLEETTFKIGYAASLAKGVNEDFKPKGFWVVKVDSDPPSGRAGVSGVYILSTTCTHLGCTPNFLASEAKFKCPCHGSGFRTTGINFEGPAPRPLERFAVSKADDGQILVDKSRKFQHEKGQWENKDAFLPI